MFEWKEEFSVNVGKVDEQHQELFRLGTELYGLIRSMSEDFDHYDEIMGVIDQLADYTEYHFESEEGMMRDKGYPKLYSHIKQHETFVAKVRSIRTDEVDLRQKKVGMDLIVFIANWIENHILVTDMQYKEYMNERGVY